MRGRRGLDRPRDLASGPGKLTQALGIDLDLNGTAIGSQVEILPPPAGTPAPQIVVGERIGITKAIELPWRFCDATSRCVSKPGLPPCGPVRGRRLSLRGPLAAGAATRRRVRGGCGSRSGLGRRRGLLGSRSGLGRGRLVGWSRRVCVGFHGLGVLGQRLGGLHRRCRSLLRGLLVISVLFEGPPLADGDPLAHEVAQISAG